MFSKFFIDRPIFACVISIVILLVGGLAIPILPVEKTPDITPPTVVVSCRYPGASAQVIAETVATPLEQQINGVDDMIYMSSKSSSDGTMEITVTFEVGTDVDMANVLVQNRVSIAEPMLPEEVKRQGITTQKKSTSMALMIALYSPQGTYDELFISNYINIQIVDVLKRIPGVADVKVFGAQDYGMRVWLDPELLKARNLGVEEVLATIREQNVQVAAGQIGAPPAPPGQVFQYTVNTLGRLSSADEFADMIVKTGADGRLLRLKDVARVELGSQTYNWYVQLNGAPAIAMGVYQLPGANALEIAEAVRTEMARLKERFPEDLEYKSPYDPTLFITESIGEVVTTLFVAIALVIFTVWLFLQDFRTTLIPSATIPVSLVGTFAVMLGLGMSINTLTLFGLVLVIGIVVDDAIVVVENTMRLIDVEKLPPKEATAKAMSEITGPVIATTLVLLAVFVPTAMMGGITGRLYSQFALTISVATVFSSINALTLSPALCGLLLRPTPEKQNWFARLFNRNFERLTNGYMKIVKRIVRRVVLPLLIFVVLCVGTGIGFRNVPGGFLPDEDEGVFMANVMLPDGASIERTRAVLDRINKILSETEGIADVTTIGGFSALDNLAVPNGGAFFVSLEPWEERPSADLHLAAIIAEIQPQLAAIEEGICLAFMLPPIAGLGMASGFEMQLQDRGGAGLAMLDTVGRDLMGNGMQHPALTRLNSSFRSNVPGLYLDIDRVKAKTMGIPLQNLFGALQTYLGSAYANDFNVFGRTYKVMLQADHHYRNTAEDILKLEIRNNQGNMVPLSTLISVEETAGPSTVFRYNLFPSSTITGAPKPGFSSGDSIGAMEQVCAQTLPPAMDFEWSGITYQQIQAGNMAPIIFGLAIVFVYLFLAAQYESWSIPVAIILTIPYALFGAIAATWARQFDNNIYTQVGLVLLIGLSAKTAILIVEFAKQLHEEGKSIAEAAAEAARLRFRALLMTAVSFILGVLPLLVASGAGAASRKALGTAVCGGMTASIIIGVFMTPVLYVVIQTLSEKVFGAKAVTPPAQVEPAKSE
jgi:HAE1 family hydrophobic/amphiphilic exporter-1